MPFLFIIFVIVPIIEIALFIQAGDWFGLAPTLAMIVLTAIIGVSLLRQQGLSTLYKAQQKMNHGEIPAMEMVEGIMLAVAGALLITPGFFTDSIAHQHKQTSFYEEDSQQTQQKHRTIEGEYKNSDDCCRWLLSL